MNTDQLIKINGITYEIGSKIPFTGIEIDYYSFLNLNILKKINFLTKLEKRFSYVDGKLEGPFKTYFKNGQLSAKGNYKGNGYMTFEHYFENGQLKAKGAFRDGSRDGKTEFYNEDGQLNSIVNHKNGKLEGPYETYFENGQLKSIEIYESGILINKDTFEYHK